MKKIVLLFAFTFLNLITFSQSIKKVKITDIKTLIDSSNHPLIINIWATWCSPCIHEIPYFEKQVATLKEQKVELILVSVDFKTDYPKKLNSFVKEKNYISKVVWLDETDANYFCPFIDKSWDGNIPVTLMVNNKKNYKMFYGGQLTEPRLKLELQKLIE